jgi:uncharacterized protein YukE
MSEAADLFPDFPDTAADVRSRASQITRLGQQLGEIGPGLQAVRGRAQAAWPRGDATTSFQARVLAAERRAAHAAQAMGNAGAALAGYASAIEVATARLRTLHAEYDQDLAGHERLLGRLASNTATRQEVMAEFNQGTMQPLHARYATLCAEVEQAARQAAAKLHAIADTAPDATTSDVEQLTLEGGGLDALDGAQLVADLLGIVDPSPVSDGISGAIAVKKGDFLGAGLSLLAMFPGGDAAKPAKVVRQLLDRFPALRRIISSADDFPRLLRLLKHVLKDPGAMKKLEESVKAGDLKGMLQGRDSSPPASTWL